MTTPAEEDAGWTIEEAVKAIIDATVLDEGVRDAVRNCLTAAGSDWFDGYLVAWWSVIELSSDAAEAIGNFLPATPGWNAVFGATQDELLSAAIDAADQASSCVVIDIAECF